MVALPTGELQKKKLDRIQEMLIFYISDSDISIRLLLAAKLFTTRGYYALHHGESCTPLGQMIGASIL